MTFGRHLYAFLTVFALVGLAACGDDPADPDPVQHTLTLTGSGAGNGTVTSAPAGITCTITAGVAGGACSTAFDEGTAVVLTAASAAGSSFIAWTGACTGAAACSVTMSADQTVDAEFDLLPARTVTVTASSTGSGAVTSVAAGIDCTSTAGVTTGTCSSTFPGGFDVVLTATPEAGSSFQLWTGDCAGTETCTLAMDADKTADAQFDIIIQRALTITGSGTGTGTVTSAPAGITCTSTAGVETGTCDTTFDDGTGVVLTATPEAGSRLVGWTGDCSGTGTCSLAMDADKTADAQFEVIPQHTLTVTGSSTGTGTVTSAPAGITCTSTAGVESGACSTAYDEGTAVVLTAAAETGSAFVGWTGACTGTGTCSVTMSADMTADAQFDVAPQRTLTVTGSSTGTGTVTSVPAGITCTSTAGVESGTCSMAVDDGTGITLTATPAGGHTFELWTGACTGTGTCGLTMDADKTADAQFDRTPPPANLIETWEAVSLTFTPTGGGATADPIAGGTELTIAFRTDFTYTLTEIDPGPPQVTEVDDGTYTVIGGVLTLTSVTFPGDVESFAIDVLTPIALEVSSSNSFFDFNDDGTETPASLVAVFQIQGTAPVQRSLTVTGSSTGTGTITSAPAGINCTSTAGVASGTCSTTFDDGTAVVLTSTAATHSSFVAWTGDCAGSGTCSLTMDADKNGNAQIDFVPPPTNLVGTWDATSITFVPAGGGASVDIIAEGVTISVVFRQDFTYTLTEVDPGPPQETVVDNGTFTVVGNALTLIPTGFPQDADTFIMTVLTATDMTLFVANDVFDFNDDGTETPASLTALFVKQ